MKYQESFIGSKSDFAAFIKKAVPELFSGKLTVEGQQVAIPQGSDLDYKVKYDADEQGGSVSIKVSWSEEEVEVDTQEEEE